MTEDYVKQMAGLQNVAACNPAITLKVRIAKAIAEAEQRLAAAKRAEEVLLKHPELEEWINLLQGF